MSVELRTIKHRWKYCSARYTKHGKCPIKKFWTLAAVLLGTLKTSIILPQHRLIMYLTVTLPSKLPGTFKRVGVCG